MFNLMFRSLVAFLGGLMALACIHYGWRAAIAENVSDLERWFGMVFVSVGSVGLFLNLRVLIRLVKEQISGQVVNSSHSIQTKAMQPNRALRFKTDGNKDGSVEFFRLFCAFGVAHEEHFVDPERSTSIFQRMMDLLSDPEFPEADHYKAGS